MDDAGPNLSTQTLPDADSVRRALERVYAEHAYELDPVPPPRDGLREFLQPWREAIWDPLVAWWESLAGRFPWADDVAAAGCLALAAVLLLEVIRRRRRGSAASPTAAQSPGPTRPEELQRLALAAGERGEYIAAARLLLRAGILAIETAERRINRPGVTNRELLRRYRHSTLHRPLTTLVEAVDRGWFGRRVCTAQEYAECVAAHGEILSAAGRRNEAQQP